MNITAEWVYQEFEQVHALVAGSRWLGYVMPLSDGRAAAFIGAGIDAPQIGGGDVDGCKAAVEAEYSTGSVPSERG